MSLDHKFSNTGAVSVGELLRSNDQFLVPKFQRNYSWNRDKVETLWEDLGKGFKKYRAGLENAAEIEYLLGPIVLVNNGKQRNSYWIIDGQQRLSTLTLLLCVARDVIRENDRDDGVGKIEDMLEITRMKKHREWKLELNDTDKNLFRRIQEFEQDSKTQLDRIKKLKTRTKSEKLLKKNYIYLHGRITESLYTNFDDLKSIKAMTEDEKKNELQKNIRELILFLTHIWENTYLVKIMVNDYNTAFQIFETLNERGQTLSKSNLIKNHVIGEVDGEEKQKTLSDKWNEIFDFIIGDKMPDDDFIMISYFSRHPSKEISNKDLYNIISKITPDDKSCIRYIDTLDDDADSISKINTIADYDRKTKSEILAVDALGAKFIRIPILAAYRRWGQTNEYRTLVSILVKFFFKYRVIREEHPQKVKEVITNITKQILNGSSLDEIIQTIKEKDDHEDFIHDFGKFMEDPTTDKIASYILHQITTFLGADDDVVPVEGLTLEHVLPRKYEKNWSEKDFCKISGIKMKNFVKRLGNLTLLTDSKNSTNNNNDFQKKKKVYEESKLHINKETIVIYDEWTSKIIEDREAKFCEYADKIWNLDKF